MTLFLGLLLLVAAEIVALVEVAQRIGVLATVLLLIAVSASGPWLVRHVGFGVWRRAQERLAVGEVPGREAVDGLLLLLAGVLICVPGFITDAFGILLLLPPVRALLRGVAERRLGRRAAASVRFGAGGRAGPVIDAGAHPSDRPPADHWPVPRDRELGGRDS